MHGSKSREFDSILEYKPHLDGIDPGIFWRRESILVCCAQRIMACGVNVVCGCQNTVAMPSMHSFQLQRVVGEQYDSIFSSSHISARTGDIDVEASQFQKAMYLRSDTED